MRDDFNALRSRYVEVFELASRTLVYIGGIKNLAQRNQPDMWPDGDVRDFRQSGTTRHLNASCSLSGQISSGSMMTSIVPVATNSAITLSSMTLRKAY